MNDLDTDQRRGAGAAPPRRRASNRSHAPRSFCSGSPTVARGHREGDRVRAGSRPADDVPPAQHARRRGPAGQGRPPPLHPRPQHGDPGPGLPARQGGARDAAGRAARARAAHRGDRLPRRLGRERHPRPRLRRGQPARPRRRGGERAVRVRPRAGQRQGAARLRHAGASAQLPARPSAGADDEEHDLRRRARWSASSSASASAATRSTRRSSRSASRASPRRSCTTAT